MTILNKINTIILHVPKTGGSSVRWPAVRKFGLRYACQHCHHKMLPREYSLFRQISFIRNPIDWYISRYIFDKFRFKTVKRARDIMTTALSYGYKLNMNETIEKYLDLDYAFKDKRTIKIYRILLKNDVMNNYTGWNISYHDNINKVGPGFFEGLSYYQWLIEIIGLKYADVIYRIEDQYEFGMKKEFGSDIKLIHKNRTPFGLKKEIITAENINNIKHKDKIIINKYGYVI